MAARKTTVTHADGTVSTRKSQTRTYSHAVEIGPAAATAAAAGKIREAERNEATATQLTAAADAGKVVITDRGFRSDESLYSHQATLAGTKNENGNPTVFTWCSADGRTRSYQGDEPVVVDAAAYLIESARLKAAQREADAASLRAEAAEITAAGAPVGTYWVARWSSRADLAHKALTEFAFYAAAGYTVRAVPVDA